MRENQKPKRIASDLLRDFRIQRGLTQADVARLLGCSDKTISGLEISNRGISLELASKIERLTNIPADLWLREPPQQDLPEALPAGSAR